MTIISIGTRLGKMLKFLTALLLSISFVSHAQKSSFRLSDFGVSYSGQLLIEPTLHNYDAFFEKNSPEGTSVAEIPFTPVSTPNTEVAPGKVLQCQLTWTQFTNCCISKRAKSIRVGLAYSAVRFLPPSFRSIDQGLNRIREERMGRSKINAIRPEVEIRRIFSSGEDDIRAFVGAGLLAEFSLRHSASITSDDYQITYKTDTINHPLAPPAYYTYESRSNIGHSTNTAKLENSITGGAFGCAGIYWLAAQGFSIELEAKAGKQARTFGHSNFRNQTFCSAGICFRFLIDRNGKFRT